MTKKNILVVDDEHLIRYSLSSMLSGDQTDVICAMSGEEALRELRQRTFDLCFFDLHLPDMKGIELLEAVRQRSPATRVIMMTGSVADAEATAVIREHAAPLLAKPFDLVKVKAMVEEIMENPRHGHRDFRTMLRRLAGDMRQSERKQATDAVRYVIHPASGSDDGDDYFATTVDVSGQGIGIRTNLPLEPGRIIRLKSDRDCIRGIVRWVAPDRQATWYRAGLQFV